MIQSLQTALKESVILKGFLGVFVIAFGMWGVGDFIQPNLNPNVAVKFEDYEVPLTEYQRRYDVQREQYRAITGQALTRDQALEQGVPQQVIQSLVQDGAIVQTANELNLTVPNPVLQDFMQRLAPFRNEDGQFDQGRVLQFMAQSGLNEGLFEEILRTEFLRNALLGSAALGARPPQAVVDQLYRHRGEARAAATLLIDYDSIEVDAAPTEDQLRETYSQNPAQFMAPEYRGFSAIVVTPDDLIGANGVTDAAVRAYYDENIAYYETPETRTVTQLLFDTEADALEAAAVAEPGMTLEDVAAKVESFPPIDLGKVAPSELPGSAGEAVYAAAVGDITGPVQSDFGWHLFRVTGINPPEAEPFDDVKDQIRETLEIERLQTEIYEAIIFIEDEIAAGGGFEEIAASLNVDVLNVPAMDRLGTTPDGTEIENLPDRDQFIATVFSTPEGVESPTMETAESEAYVIRVNTVRPSGPRPFDQVKDEVADLWVELEKARKAQAMADDMIAQLGPGTDLASFADGDGITFATLGPITRTGTPTDAGYLVDPNRLSSAVLNAVFTTPVSEVTTAEARNGLVVARVDEIIPAKQDTAGQVKQSIEAGLTGGMRDDLLTQVLAALVDRTNATVNTDSIRETTGL